jgi:hypothetical protein
MIRKIDFFFKLLSKHYKEYILKNFINISSTLNKDYMTLRYWIEKCGAAEVL